MEERNNMNFFTNEMIDKYGQYLKEEERGRATVEKYLRDVRKFREYLNLSGRNKSDKTESDSNGFDKETVLEYKQYLNEHYKTTSANSMLAAINSFFEYLGCEEYKVKLFRIQRMLFSEPERELTEKDYERLVRAAERKSDSRMSMLLQTIGSTGIRISELRFITVESLAAGRANIYNKGKSRVALLSVELTRMLKKYCKKVGITQGSIFITKSGKPMDRSNISKKMKELGREAGVDERKVFPHNFRHLFARIFYRIEKDVVRLMDLLGHSSINTTRIYTMTTEEQPRRQMSRMKMVLG
ncbi:MAG: tyrosine-type recombinase/integrase [Hungatella hathewayi]|nr:tyrosine-type recombinase/integrase [Hungatella hathewayi]